jgi:hypothetical protein
MQRVNDSASALGPELQTLKYMEIFDHDFGILQMGKLGDCFIKNYLKVLIEEVLILILET